MCMNLLPEPPPPGYQNPNPFPKPPRKPPDFSFSPKFDREDTAFQTTFFLESHKVDHQKSQFETCTRLVANLRGPLAFQHKGQYQS